MITISQNIPSQFASVIAQSDVFPNWIKPETTKEEFEALYAKRPVSESRMTKDGLFNKMQFASKEKVFNTLLSMNETVSNRINYELHSPRKGASGNDITGQYNGVPHLERVWNNIAVARLFVALNLDAVQVLFPQLRDTGKQSDETSSSYGYSKMCDIAEQIFFGQIMTKRGNAEKVITAFFACAYVSTRDHGMEVITRDYCENFLTGTKFKDLGNGSDELWSAIDHMRLKSMSGGSPTQCSQMIRTLVNLKSGKDVRTSRRKDLALDVNGIVAKSLARRLGIEPMQDEKQAA